MALQDTLDVSLPGMSTGHPRQALSDQLNMIPVTVVRLSHAISETRGSCCRLSRSRFLLPFGRMRHVARVRRVPPLDKPNVAIISAVPPNPCRCSLMLSGLSCNP